MVGLPKTSRKFIPPFIVGLQPKEGALPTYYDSLSAMGFWHLQSCSCTADLPPSTCDNKAGLQDTLLLHGSRSYTLSFAFNSELPVTCLWKSPSGAF